MRNRKGKGVVAKPVEPGHQWVVAVFQTRGEAGRCLAWANRQAGAGMGLGGKLGLSLDPAKRFPFDLSADGAALVTTDLETLLEASRRLDGHRTIVDALTGEIRYLSPWNRPLGIGYSGG